MVQTMEKRQPYFTQLEQLNAFQQGRDGEQAIQAVIVDTHRLIREALQRVIGSFPHTVVAASLSQIQDIPEVLKKGEIDVLILGSSVTASDCLECIKLLQKGPTSPGVVVIQQRLLPETVFPIIRSGVQSLLGEDSSEYDLARAIVAAATGNTFLDQRAREILDLSVSHIPRHFTQRELQVLVLLRLGISNFRIAQQLGLKEKTVEKHLTHIYEKLHIRSRAEAILRIQTLYL